MSFMDNFPTVDISIATRQRQRIDTIMDAVNAMPTGQLRSLFRLALEDKRSQHGIFAVLSPVIKRAHKKGVGSVMVGGKPVDAAKVATLKEMEVWRYRQDIIQTVIMYDGTITTKGLIATMCSSTVGIDHWMQNMEIPQRIGVSLMLRMHGCYSAGREHIIHEGHYMKSKGRKWAILKEHRGKHVKDLMDIADKIMDEASLLLAPPQKNPFKDEPFEGLI